MTYANGTADPVGLDATRFETRIGHEGYVRRRGDIPDTLDHRRMNALARSLAHVLATHEPASPDPT